MCDPTCNPVKQPQPTQTGLFIDLLSLTDSMEPVEKPKCRHAFVPIVLEIASEARSLLALSFPIILTALILYSRSMVSMLFLGRLGDLELAAGSLSIAFANITGYSVLSGLALGMEPLCSQAFGARRPKLLSLTLHRSVIFLLLCSVPISILWLNVSGILLRLHQDQKIAGMAHTYLVFSLPDLLTNSFLHPIRIYLRAQGITHPVTLASLLGTLFHIPANLLLVIHLRLGVAGVAAASAASNAFVVISLILYVWVSRIHEPTWTSLTPECLKGWLPLLRLAAPSCVSVCLEWWWYEIMIVLCGLLSNPKSAVASMGILIQTTSFLYVFPSSLGFAVSTRVGNELGANRPGRAKLSAVVAVFFAATMGLSAATFATSMRDGWARGNTIEDTEKTKTPPIRLFTAAKCNSPAPPPPEPTPLLNLQRAATRTTILSRLLAYSPESRSSPSWSPHSPESSVELPSPVLIPCKSSSPLQPTMSLRSRSHWIPPPAGYVISTAALAASSSPSHHHQLRRHHQLTRIIRSRESRRGGQGSRRTTGE